MRRVVVTGLGMVTPLACGVEPTWQRLLAGESGIRRIENFEVSDLPCKIAGQIPRGEGSDGTFNADQWMEPEGAAQGRRLYPFCHGGGETGARRRRLAPARIRRPDHQRRPHRLRHRRHRGYRGNGFCCCVIADRDGCRHSSFPAGSSISLPDTCRSRIRSRVPTAPWSPPALPARTPSATPAGLSRSATRTSWWPAARIAGQPLVACRLCRMPGVVDRIQRRARARIEAL